MPDLPSIGRWLIIGGLGLRPPPAAGRVATRRRAPRCPGAQRDAGHSRTTCSDEDPPRGKGRDPPLETTRVADLGGPCRGERLEEWQATNRLNRSCSRDRRRDGGCAAGG